MKYDMVQLKERILETFITNQIRHEMHDSPSGCSMIDFWIGGDLFVIQLEPEGLGFSTVTENIDFSTIPEKWYYDENDFLQKISSTIEKNK